MLVPTRPKGVLAEDSADHQRSVGTTSPRVLTARSGSTGLFPLRRRLLPPQLASRIPFWYKSATIYGHPRRGRADSELQGPCCHRPLRPSPAQRGGSPEQSQRRFSDEDRRPVFYGAAVQGRSGCGFLGEGQDCLGLRKRLLIPNRSSEQILARGLAPMARFARD